MQYLKTILLILGLLSSFVTIAADNSITNTSGKASLVGASYKARINTPKAIVYADENMLSPLGYITDGKAIVVGNPRKINRDLVPLVIYGRLAFIEIKDIRYEDGRDEDFSINRGAPREHNFDITLEKAPEVLSKNNSFYFSLHQFSAGNEVKDAFYNTQGVEETTFSGFNLQFIHRQSNTRYFWGAGLDYSSISSEDMNFAFWMLSPTFGFTPFRTSLFLIDVYGSLDLAMNTVFEIDNNDVSEPSGYVWGPQVNARLVLFPDSKYHLAAGVGLRKYIVSGLKDLKNSTGDSVGSIGGITGVNAFLSIGMEF